MITMRNLLITATFNDIFNQQVIWLKAQSKIGSRNSQELCQVSLPKLGTRVRYLLDKEFSFC